MSTKKKSKFLKDAVQNNSEITNWFKKGGGGVKDIGKTRTSANPVGGQVYEVRKEPAVLAIQFETKLAITFEPQLAKIPHKDSDKFVGKSAK